MVKPRSAGLFHKKLFIAIGVLLLAVIAVAVLELTNTTHIFHKKPVPPTIPVTSNKKSPSSGKTSGTSSGQSASQTTSKVASPGGGGSSNLTLAQPYGDLVSNHSPGQNGSGTKEQSTCNTTPGATCYIQFTNTSSGDTTKLPAQTVSSDGSTTWAWDANILSSGSWQVTAFASLNGQTKSVTDPMKLEIQ